MSNGNPMRQISITESFKQAKNRSFKMAKPFYTSNIPIPIDSDSEEEASLSFECERKQRPVKLDLKETMDRDVCSPAKRPKVMIGVHRPETSTPKSSIKTEEFPFHISRVESLSTISPVVEGPITDSPHSIASDASERTLLYNYSDGTFDASTVPFSQERSELSIQERLVLNDPRNFVDDASQNALDSSFEAVSRNHAGSPQSNKSHPSFKRRLFDEHARATNNTLIEATVQNNPSITNSESSIDIPSKKPKAIRKPKKKIVGEINSSNNGEQRVDIPIQKPARRPRKQKGGEQPSDSPSKKPKAPRKPRKKVAREVSEANGNIPCEKPKAVKTNEKKIVSEQTSNADLSPKEKKLSKIIDKLRANKDLSVTAVNDGLNTPAAQIALVTTQSSISSSQKTVGASVLRSTPLVKPSSTGWTGKGASSRKRKIQEKPEQDSINDKENAKEVNKECQELSTSKSCQSVTNVTIVNGQHGISASREPNNIISTANKMTQIGQNSGIGQGEKSPENTFKGQQTSSSSNSLAAKTLKVKQGISPSENNTNTKGTNKNMQTPAKKVVVDAQGPSCTSVLQNTSTNSPTDIGANKNVPALSKKVVMDEQQPSCSKSSTVNVSSVKKSFVTTTLAQQSGLNTNSNAESSTKIGGDKSLASHVQSTTVNVKLSTSVVEKSKNATSLKEPNAGTSRIEQTPKKIVPDTQEPSTSKASSPDALQTMLNVKSNTSGIDTSKTIETPKKRAPNDQTSSTNIYTTPKKHSPFRAGSPRKPGYRSPFKGSPSKNREIKNLKAKEGKRLQVKQLDELVGLLKTVASNRHLKPLLTPDEFGILCRFVKMEDNQKYFVMKLYVWKKAWYNIFKFCRKAQLEYRDDKEIIDIFEFLRDEKFVDTDYVNPLNMVELLNELERPQIKEVMDELRIRPNKGTKEELIQNIVMATNSQTTLTKGSIKDLVMKKIAKKLGFAVKIKDEVFNAFYNFYLLATFTNPNFEDIQQYFRNIIHNGMTFPRAPVEEYLVFYSREKFQDYVRALKVRMDLGELLVNKTQGNKLCEIYRIGQETYDFLRRLNIDDGREHSNAPHLKRFSAEHVYCGVLSSCCENMFTKKNGKPEDVKIWLEFLIGNFPQSRKLGKWYYRLMWLHMKHLEVISYETAAKLLIEVLDTKMHLLGERAQFELGSLGDQLKSSRKHKIDQMYHDRIAKLISKMPDMSIIPQNQIDSQCIRSNVMGKKRVYISRDDEGMTVRPVEEVAMKYYAENGYPGGDHCEGSYFRALLVLYFWDIIYNPERNVPGTFISKLQSAPLDMHTPYFYQNRREGIETRLKQIEFQWSEEELIQFGAKNFQDHSHEYSAFSVVCNVITDLETMEVLVTVTGRKVLAKIFQRLIKNIREFSSGMPDLFVWNIDEKTHKFVEVKGEGDRLAPNQILWLNYLKEIGASVEVCWVHSTGSKRKKINKECAEHDGAEASTSANTNDES